MKAIVFDQYGDPDVLVVRDVEAPLPGPGEIRIRIHAAGVNPVDAKIRLGLLANRLPNVFPIIPGWDASGVVDATGSGCSRFKTGDEVFAYCRKPIIQFGTYAEYVVIPEASAAPKPLCLKHEQAASIPLAALTAWQALFDAAGLRSGQTVLIHAGAGGVGGFAVQLARNAGARVLATASAANHDYVRSLGAEVMIDYTAEDFRTAVRRHHPGGVDVAFDAVGGEVQERSAEVVRPGGCLVSILAYRDEAALKARGISTRYVFVAPNQNQLMALADQVEKGSLSTRLAAVLALEDAPTAHRMIETRHTAGKIVLRLP